MSAIKKKKGQVLSPDFILSIVIFTAILFLSYTIWNISYEKSTRFYKTEEMQRKAFYISNALINTPGVPADWNTSDVMMIGLKNADDDILDTEKILNFKLLSYSDSKALLGVGSYEYYINVTDPHSKPLKVGGAIKGTAAVFARDAGDDIARSLLATYYDIWDYYWGSAIAVPANNARYVYKKGDYTPSTQDKLFSVLVSNISAYQTIMLENPQVTAISPADKNAIREFVYEGGTYITTINTGDYDVLEYVFDDIITPYNNGDNQGTYINKDILLPDSNVGEFIQFQSQGKKFKKTEVDKAIVEDNTDNNYCIVCLWYYGSGKIYYLPDAGIDNNNPIAGLDMDGIEISFGDDAVINSENLVPITRFIMIGDSNEIRPGIMHLYIYTNRTI
ncbi:MAG: hypothetical protein ABIG84_00445 [archaeon]